MESKFQILDAFNWVGPCARREPGTPYSLEELLIEHGRVGIRHRLCTHVESRDNVPAEGNAEMSLLASQHAGTGVVWVALPPRRFHAEPVGKFMASAEQNGVAMFTIYPKKQTHHIASWANSELYLAMEEARVPLALEMDQVTYAEVYDLARAHPKMPIVLWNCGYQDERMLIPILDLCPNVHVGLAVRFIPTDGIEQFTKRYGPERLIFGSGWPAQQPGPLITYVTYADVSDDAKNAILSGNIRRLVSGVRWKVRGFEGGAR